MKSLLVFFVLLCSSQLYADNIINSKKAYSQRDCFSGNSANFDSWRKSIFKNIERKNKKSEKIAKRKASFDKNFNEEDFNRAKENIVCATFNYVVDGSVVAGYVIKPKNIDKDLPVLIFNRGGNGSYGAMGFHGMIKRLFPIAEQGFVIIGSQYRGVNVYRSPIDDQFGGRDVEDVLALFPFIKKIDGANSRKIGMFGASRGGMQTFLALKETKKIKAVAVIASPSDFFAELKRRPEMEKVFRKRVPDYEQNRVAELERRSVIKWVDELPKKVPVLLLHGTADKRAHVDNATSLAAELTKHKIPHKLVLYPEDDHGLSNNRESANGEIVDWFNRHL